MPSGVYKRTEWHKKINREGQIGKKLSQTTKDKMKNRIPWNKGVPRSVETRDKIGDSLSGRFGGDNHPNWQGGISKDIKHINLMRKRLRDKKGKQYVQMCNNKRRDLTIDLTLKVIQLVYEDNIKKFGTLTCYLCLEPIEFGKDSLEHKTPLSRGGTNKYNNLAIACRSCNSKKNTKTEKEYKQMEVIK